MNNTNTESEYEQLGGADGVKAVVVEFYKQMDTLSEAAPIRAMHPKNLDASIEKLFEFLCGWLGGPQLYVEKHGHPRLRMRHMPFSIGRSESEQWLRCMDLALKARNVEAGKRALLMDAFGKVANHMINQNSPA
ncbi:MAG: group II truncated hemoglobin [Deltaproteobacteria bacterium]|nr:group II truncated hemoglobin [Deltaproteobacteria bacterium]